MDAQSESLYAEAMKLEPAAREDLALRLMESVDKETLDVEWGSTIARRVEEISTGKAQSVPAQTLHQAMRARLGE